MFHLLLNSLKLEFCRDISNSIDLSRMNVGALSQIERRLIGKRTVFIRRYTDVTVVTLSFQLK